MLVNLLIGLYTSRAILDVLGIEDYGIYNVVAGFVSMASVFTNSTASAARRFITVELGRGDKDNLKKTYSTLLVIIGIISILILLLGELFGSFFLDDFLVIPESRLESAHIVYHCSLIIFIVNFLTVPNNAIITAHERMNFFAVISIGQSLAKLAIVLLLYVAAGDKLAIYAVCLVIIDILVRLIYGLYCTHNFQESRFVRSFDHEIFRRIFSYSIWASVGSGSAILKEQGINVLINLFFGVTMNAARGVSIQVQNIVNLFSTNIGTAISPQIMKSFAKGQKQRAVNLTIIQGKVQGILIILLSMPLILDTHYLLNLWLKVVPDYAVIFTQWALILVMARTIQNTHTPIFLANGNIKFLEIVAGGIMLLNLPLSYLFLSIGYPAVITMIIGTIIEIICTFIIYFYLHYLISFPVVRFFREVFFPILLVGFFSFGVIYKIISFFSEESLSRFMMILFSSFALVGSLSYYIILNKRERQYALELLHNIAKRNR